MHAIRLREPWSVDGSLNSPKWSYSRKFNCPTGLEPDQIVRLRLSPVADLPSTSWSQLASLALELNTMPLDTMPLDTMPLELANSDGLLLQSESLTGRLEAFNQLILTIPALQPDQLAVRKITDADVPPPLSDILNVQLVIT